MTIREKEQCSEMNNTVLILLILFIPTTGLELEWVLYKSSKTCCEISEKK